VHRPRENPDQLFWRTYRENRLDNIGDEAAGEPELVGPKLHAQQVTDPPRCRGGHHSHLAV
jgi:hypothetical protein